MYNCFSKIKKEENDRKDFERIDVDIEKERNMEDKFVDELFEVFERNDVVEVWDLVENNYFIEVLKIM